MSEEKKAKERTGFILYFEDAELLEDLDDHQTAVLFRSIFAYQCKQPLPDMDQAVKMAFRIFRRKFELDAQKYEETCARNRANGSKGGRPRKDTAEENPREPTETQNNRGVFPETQRNPEEPKKPKSNLNLNNNLKDIDNDYISNHILSNQSETETEADEMGWDKISPQTYLQILKRNINYDFLREEYEDNVLKSQMLDELLQIMLDVLTSKKTEMVVCGELKPVEVVRSRFLQINGLQIGYAIDCLMKNESVIKNPVQYTIATLYKASTTSTLQFINGVRQQYRETDLPSYGSPA